MKAVKNKNLIFVTMFLFVIMLSLSLASATVSWSVPDKVQQAATFDVIISGNGFYAVEVNIPLGISYVSNNAGGTHSGNLFRATSTGDIKLTLKGDNINNYIISGSYTEGSGVINLDNKNVEVTSNAVTLSCPQCPDSSEWNACSSGTESRTSYTCSQSTNYKCTTYTEKRACGEAANITTQLNNLQNTAPTAEATPGKYSGALIVVIIIIIALLLVFGYYFFKKR